MSAQSVFVYAAIPENASLTAQDLAEHAGWNASVLHGASELAAMPARVLGSRYEAIWRVLVEAAVHAVERREL